mgnify:CR=1 FL=1
MSASRLDTQLAAELADIARAALLCNDAILRETDGEWQLEGDPTEGALLALAMKAGLDARFEAESLPRIDVIPFESEHRFMATLHHDHAGHAFVFVKGAPERLIGMCAGQRRAGQDEPIDPAYWQARIDALAAEGYRVLALAMAPMAKGQRELAFADVEGGLTLLATTGATAPFVGLLGTVWGIYHALLAIGLSGQAALEKVAGPVGEALIMTAAGLAVALPAVFAYNAFTRANRVILADLDAFAHDLHAFFTVGKPFVANSAQIHPMRARVATEAA